MPPTRAEYKSIYTANVRKNINHDMTMDYFADDSHPFCALCHLFRFR
jgi:hypothetical protein